MRDFALKTSSTYDDPLGFPGCCELCGSSKLPLLDTRVTRPSSGGVLPGGNIAHGAATEVRVYICGDCFIVQAKTWGVGEGEKHKELMESGQLLEEARAEVERVKKLLSREQTDAELLRIGQLRLEEQVESWRSKFEAVQQRLDQIREDTLATVSAVAGDDA